MDCSIHRYYEPTTGQFTTLDPAVASTGHPYQYAGNDPVNGSDPSGEWANICHGVAGTHDAGGYWLASADGGVFAFGDAHFAGSCPSNGSGCENLEAPMVGIERSPGGAGYSTFSADGGVFAFGDAPFQGAGTGRTGGPPAV